MATRIPGKIKDFGVYIVATNKYLQKVVVPTNGIRVGLTAANVTEWDTRTTAWVLLFAIYNDSLVVNADTRKQVRTFIKKFKAFAQPLLNVVAASPNATDSDGTVFNVVLTRKNPSHNTVPMTSKCNALQETLGGAKFKFKCRTIADAKRASLFAEADSVEIAFVIGDKDMKAPSPDEIVNRQVFTKATFMLNCGTANAGQYLYIYFRWNNTKYPALAGPWSSFMILQILL